MKAPTAGNSLKALGMRPVEVERFCQRMPADELEEEPPPLHLLPGPYRAAVPLIERLVGRFQHLSVHPGRVVIAEPPIDSQVPLERAPKGVRVTQFDKRGLAAIPGDQLRQRLPSKAPHPCTVLDRLRGVGQALIHLAHTRAKGANRGSLPFL